MNIEFNIEAKAWNKVINYAASAYDQFKSEIGGMMVAIEDEEGDWELVDPIILKQKVSAGNTHLDQEELAAYYTKAAMKYKKYNFRFCWWHSHHTMGAFWSGTDTNTIDEFSDGDFSFALVVNLKEEYKFRVSVWKPMEVHKDVELNILGRTKNIPKSINSQVKDLCSKESLGSMYSYNNRVLGVDQGTLFNDTTLINNEPVYMKVYKEIDRLHSSLASGELTFGNYSRKIIEMNELLLADDTGISIKEVSRKELENLLLVTGPGDFIEHEIVDIDEINDYNSWNRSFGI